MQLTDNSEQDEALKPVQAQVQPYVHTGSSLNPSLAGLKEAPPTQEKADSRPKNKAVGINNLNGLQRAQ